MSTNCKLVVIAHKGKGGNDKPVEFAVVCGEETIAIVSFHEVQLAYNQFVAMQAVHKKE